MRCHGCGGTIVEKAGRLQLTDKFAGPFTVENVEYSECEKCGERLFSPHAARQIEEARERALQNVLRSQPIGAYMSGTEAATILGISRQALHKHRRIRRGFIFQTRFGDKTVYLRKSVDRFKATGDGRFPIQEPRRVKRAHEMKAGWSLAAGSMIRSLRTSVIPTQIHIESQPKRVGWKPQMRRDRFLSSWHAFKDEGIKVHGKAEEGKIGSPGNIIATIAA